jgi:hypothetical protein
MITAVHDFWGMKSTKKKIVTHPDYSEEIDSTGELY